MITQIHDGIWAYGAAWEDMNMTVKQQGYDRGRGDRSRHLARLLDLECIEKNIAALFLVKVQRHPDFAYRLRNLY